MNFINKLLKNILILLAVIVFVGILADFFARKKYNALSDEEKLNLLISEQKAYYDGLEKAQNNEWWINIVTRLVIATVLVSLNLYYFCYISLQEEFMGKLNDVVLINEAIILGYTLVAFIIAGTPSKFVQTVRNAIFNLRVRYHVRHISIDEVNAKTEALKAQMAANKNI